MDSVAQLSGAIRRLADEPNIQRRVLAALTELLGANYLFASDLASMPVLVKLRGAELEESAKAEIEAVRNRVVALLAPSAPQADEKIAPQASVNTAPPPREALSAFGQSLAMTHLARRLAHIEHAAEKVARLAARPIIDTTL